MKIFQGLLRSIANRFMMTPSSQMHVTVVGTGNHGTPKSVLICTDTTRYLINCGEGTQRILTEHKSKASKIQHVFFTRMSWRHLSGLLGIALTVKMAGVKKMFVHGPPSAVELMKLTRHFADASTTEVVQSDILRNPLKDNDFIITAFELNGEDSTESRTKNARIDDTAQSQSLYAYLFQGLKVNRKLIPANCIAHGIPTDVLHSPKIRQLIEGRPLVLDDGRVVLPEAVTSEPPVPRNVLLLECPHESYIPRFLHADHIFNAIANFQEGENSVRGTVPGITLAVHLVPPGLFESPAYQTFVARLNQFGQSNDVVTNVDCSDGTLSTVPDSGGLHHLVLDGSSSRRGCPPVTGIFSQSITLNTYFDSHLYPKLMALHSLEPKVDLSHVEPFSRVVYAEPMMRYSLRGHMGFKVDNCVILDEEELLQQAFDPLYVSKEEAENAFKKMRDEIDVAIDERAISGVTSSSLDKLEWPEFTFLGTASSSPSKYRNISAILVRLSPDECILLDCAEGTLNQLYALYGCEETHRLLCGLRLILITHMHADHHGGVLTVARKAYELTRDPTGLAVLSPPPFWKWVNGYTSLFQNTANHVRLFPINRVYEAPTPQMPFQPSFATASANTERQVSEGNLTTNPIWQLRRSSNDEVISDWRQLLSQLKLKIDPVRVPHTGTSWAFVLSRMTEADEGTNDESRLWKVVYSGDTPPCYQLAEAGRDCDLLIHEATMADGYEELALAARHSTTSEAIEIGRLMRAKFILLTHFSQRFSRLPSFDTFQKDIAPAFDFMQVRLGELWKLPYYLPFYKYAFARHWDVLQTRADANQQRKARAKEAIEDTRTVVNQALGDI